MTLSAALALTAVGVFRWEDLPRLLAVLTGALAVVLGLVFMQVWRNRRTMITSEGVYRAGWWGGCFIPWSEVERVERVGDTLLRIRGARGSVDLDLDLVEDPDRVVAALSFLVLGPAAEALQRGRNRQ